MSLEDFLHQLECSVESLSLCWCKVSVEICVAGLFHLVSFQVWPVSPGGIEEGTESLWTFNICNLDPTAWSHLALHKLCFYACVFCIPPRSKMHSSQGEIIKAFRGTTWLHELQWTLKMKVFYHSSARWKKEMHKMYNTESV